MAGIQKKRTKTGKNTESRLKKPSKSSNTARSSTLAKTKAKTTQRGDSVPLASQKKKDSSLSSLKNLKKTTIPTSSTQKSLKETISDILKTRTTEEKLRQSSNILRARDMVSGDFREPGRPKKHDTQKEKMRSLRASDEFIALAKQFATLDGFDGKWQTWLKNLAKKRFQEVANR